MKEVPFIRSPGASSWGVEKPCLWLGETNPGVSLSLGVTCLGACSAPHFFCHSSCFRSLAKPAHGPVSFLASDLVAVQPAVRTTALPACPGMGMGQVGLEAALAPPPPPPRPCRCHLPTACRAELQVRLSSRLPQDMGRDRLLPLTAPLPWPGPWTSGT